MDKVLGIYCSRPYAGLKALWMCPGPLLLTGQLKDWMGDVWERRALLPSRWATGQERTVHPQSQKCREHLPPGQNKHSSHIHVPAPWGPTDRWERHSTARSPNTDSQSHPNGLGDGAACANTGTSRSRCPFRARGTSMPWCYTGTLTENKPNSLTLL